MTEPATKLPVKTESARTPALFKGSGWPSFDAFRDEMDRLFDRLTGSRLPRTFARSPFDMEATFPRGAMFEPELPAIDVAESDTGYEITAELPGLDEKDIEVKLTNGSLVITGEKKDVKEERSKGYFVSERRYGSFARAFALPPGIDRDKIEASFAKGVLTLRLPKTEEFKAEEKRIEIKAA